jgi:hypothetical protein
MKCLLNHGINHDLGIIQIIGGTKEIQFFLHTNHFLACHKISGINHHKKEVHKISNNMHYFLLLLLKTTLIKTIFLLRNLNYMLNLLQIRTISNSNLYTKMIQLIRLILQTYKR